MIPETALLSLTAGWVGVLHTLLGPDHYVPFVAMSKAGQWRRSKTVMVTAFCGTAHLLSSALIGLVGILLGVAVNRIEIFEAWRGEIATWFLIGFGLIYFIWGIRRSFRNHSSHVHPHGEGDPPREWSPWLLFILLVLGPCEPLIPILLYPAAKGDWIAVVGVFGIFSLGTLLTMVGIVLAADLGWSLLPFHRWERFVHPLTGAALCFTGFLCYFFKF